MDIKKYYEKYNRVWGIESNQKSGDEFKVYVILVFENWEIAQKWILEAPKGKERFMATKTEANHYYKHCLHNDADKLKMFEIRR